jgi:tetratricopeptide (TPR) repeat protein
MADSTPPAAEPVTPAAAAPAKKPRESTTVRRMTKLGRTLGSVRTVVTNALVLSAVVAIVGLGIREIVQNATVIDPIDLPKDLVDLGYSPQVFAARLGDERQAIYTKSKTRPASGKAPGRIGNGAMQANLDIPGTGLSVKSAIRFGRQVLGLPETHISGDATHDGENLVLVLRSTGGAGGEPARVRVSNVNDLVRLGAQEIVRMIEPFILAAYSYEEEAETGNVFERTRELITYVLEHPPASDDRRAYDLWGQVLAKQSDPDGAIAKYKKALSLEPRDAFAHNEWGTILMSKGDAAGAIEHFKQALAISPLDRGILSSNLCNALNVANRYDEALVKCLEATAADLTYAPAHHNLGLTYENLKKYDQAIDAYKNARALAPTLAEPCVGWENVLRAQHKDAKTDEAYKLLCGTKSGS